MTKVTADTWRKFASAEYVDEFVKLRDYYRQRSQREQEHRDRIDRAMVQLQRVYRARYGRLLHTLAIRINQRNAIELARICAVDDNYSVLNT